MATVEHSSPVAGVAPGPLDPLDTFARRHIGPSDADIAEMLTFLGHESLEALTAATIPESIRSTKPLTISDPTNGGRFPVRGESECLSGIRRLASGNQVFRSYLGMGYSDCLTPAVILRNVMENPGWYTQYTPYQAEVAQGRLECLLNFQTMCTELTGLEVAGASLLDEGTAAAEAMTLCLGAGDGKRRSFFVAEDCHPQTIEVVRTRAKGLGVTLIVGDPERADFTAHDLCGALLAYPGTDGRVVDWRGVIARVKAAGAMVAMVADPLALTLLTPPGELGADVAVGSMQRFGVPMGFGGPHAAYFATRNAHVRRMPGRLIGVSKDSHGRPALRLSIQTREQHIRRDKATSNICTAQALLANMAALYGIYHGPDGLRRIAERVHRLAGTLAAGAVALGHEVLAKGFFDTIRVRLRGTEATKVISAARERRMNLRAFADGTVGIALDETTLPTDLQDLLDCLATGTGKAAPRVVDLRPANAIPPSLRRGGAFMAQDIFNRYHSETELLRYIFHLQGKDLSLAHSMIPLGSCTMKLNATAEMIPVTWPEFGRMHPFAPTEQCKGYAELARTLESWLCDVTGFAAVSLQPNSGSQGEYAGLMVIRAWHESRGQSNRDICLIPESAHGTNPASAIVAGMRVVPVACDDQGNVDLDDLSRKAREHAANLACCMITYPSTHGVFEDRVRELCEEVHRHGGQVYMDGANMNAQVGLTRPGEIGADVCHLNLHKTFCIPHGGGGPGVGPIGVASHLAPFLPGHPVIAPAGTGPQAIGPVSAAPYGSASILPISWVYISLMGAQGLQKATQVAILSANYMAKRLEGHYDVLYTNANGRCAHEFIVDCRPFDKAADVKIDDIAKRLMDFGFHAPTMSWPVPGTLMIEPTESESKEELDRFCEAMIQIRREIDEIASGRMDRKDNPLKNAPHTAEAVGADEWKHGYPRSQAAYPLPWVRHRKFWPAVGRVDNPYGDRNLVCSCEPLSAYR
ncbi:MAG: glycine dehydrogenase (aminomethyl-transferring) [Planctomycetes bacterium]|nr:glycine dehydrogenase (aminomethyl-transferring) [Planctomycetota bacterium]